MKKQKLKFKKIEDGFIVYTDSTHAHLPTLTGCHTLLRLIHNGTRPQSPYLDACAQRLLPPALYDSLK